MHKNWKAISAIEDSTTRLHLMTIEHPEILQMLSSSRPDLFLEEPSVPIPLSTLIDLSLKRLREQDVYKEEPEEDIRPFAATILKEACAAHDIPLVTFGTFSSSELEQDKRLLPMPPEVLMQVFKGVECDQSGQILRVNGTPLIVVEDSGGHSEPRFIVVTLAPFECIDGNA